MLCVAPMCVPPWDRGWYRAVTCAYMPDTDEVLIKYVDYGGYARIATDELRQIRWVDDTKECLLILFYRSDFTTLPFQAVECYLAHVVPVPSKGVCNDEIIIIIWNVQIVLMGCYGRRKRVNCSRQLRYKRSSKRQWLVGVRMITCLWSSWQPYTMDGYVAHTQYIHIHKC